MPQTYERLRDSAEMLSYAKKWLKVLNFVMSKETGDMLFATGGMKSGVKNKGLGACMAMSEAERKKHCQLVRMYSLNDYVEAHVEANNKDPINILSIGVEGFDGECYLVQLQKYYRELNILSLNTTGWVHGKISIFLILYKCLMKLLT